MIEDYLGCPISKYVIENAGEAWYRSSDYGISDTITYRKEGKNVQKGWDFR